MSSLTGIGGELLTPSLTEAGTDLARLGGKGAILARLAVAGFPVPAGFVITTEAYRRQLAGIALGPGEPAELRRRIEAAPLESVLAEQLRRAYDRLGGGRVAVRSSATAEDLPGAAFAGQQDTFLDVTAGDLAAAVARCWASLWTDRAVAYRRRLRIEPSEVSIAVVVQRMVPAEVAGVLFTADPVTGRRDRIMIDAAAGLGDALVSGEVTPEHYLLDAAGRQVEFRPGHPAAGRPLLDPAQLRRLAELGVAVRDHFGGPQDLEWALADGQVRLLQARPMTALPTPARVGRRQRLASSVVSDYLVQRPYPLDVTTWLEHGPAGMMLRLVSGAGLGLDLAALLPETDGVVTRLQPVSPRPNPRLLVALPAMLFRAHRFQPDRWRSDPRVGQFRRRLAALSDDPSRLHWADLVRRPRDLFRVAQLAESIREDFLPGMAVALGRLWLRLALIRQTRLFGDLIGGAVTETTIMNDRLAALAAMVRRRPEVARIFAAEPIDQLLVRLRQDPRLAELAAEFDRLLADYGHRETVSPVLISPPTWIDQPEAPLGTIKALAGGGEPPASASRAAAAEAIVFGKRSLADPQRRAAMRRAIDQARAGAAFREDSHDLITRPAPVLRRCLLELGRRLQSAGVLAEPFDVFHLRLPEIELITDPDRLDQAERDRLTRLVRRRAIIREELAAVPMINRSVIFGPAADDGDAIVTGTPAGAGVVTGPARVITGPAEFGTLRRGEVLVCPYTNPAWTPLFQSAVAVVADTGGVGSHAAIVAREYGLPAIMGTGDGTVRLRTGDRIRVDGTTGRVTAADGAR